MFVLTVDQIDSRHSRDRVEAVIADLAARADHLLAAPERTAGDEFQVATREAAVALDLALHLVRLEEWSVGLGVGDLIGEAGPSVRALSGSAFVNAREAVTAAKKRPARFALVTDDDAETARLDPLLRLLLALRERRTAEGWELFDLLEGDPPLTSKDAAARLGISAQAASQRALTAGLRLDTEARTALVALLEAADARIGA
jgi:hypothetical protein